MDAVILSSLTHLVRAAAALLLAGFVLVLLPAMVSDVRGWGR